MKVIIFCLLIMGLSIAFGLYSYHYLTISTNEMLAQTAELDHLVDAGNWTRASEHLKNIHQDWKKYEQIWSLLINHEEIDNIELTLARLENYIKIKNQVQSLGEISALEHWIKHIPEKEAVSLPNIF